MESFKKHIQAINQSDWDYYYDISGWKFKHPFISNRSHKQFIKKYFHRSGKGKVYEFISFLPGKKLDNNRLKHTSSIFFLGVLLNTKTSIQYRVLTENTKPSYGEFPFIWFLTCLFHDFAFTIEEDANTISEVQNFDDLLNHFDIRNSLLVNEKYTNELFPPNLVKNYFKFRREHEKLDHGILGGLYLFDKLLEIRKAKFNNRHNDLYWGEDLILQYAQACYAIACHNIWLPKKSDYSLYKRYGLSKLVEDFEPISLNEFPLLFILGIVDTIDPIKTYLDDKIRPSEIMSNVMFEFHPNHFSIATKDNSPFDIEELKSRASNLEGWLDVSVSASNGKLDIIFARN